MSEHTHEYLLIIKPKGTVEQKANEVKYVYKYDYGCVMAFNQSHITLLNFILVGRWMEERVLKFFEGFFASLKPFDVEVNGFDHFSTHTIFLKIISKASIVKMVKGIRNKFYKYLTPHGSFPPFFCTEPHLTIARRMRPDQFEKVWPIWENQEFNGSFNVDEVVLIRRRLLERNKCQIIGSFNLRGRGGDPIGVAIINFLL